MKNSPIRSLKELWALAHSASKQAEYGLPALARLRIDLSGSKIGTTPLGHPDSLDGPDPRQVVIEELEVGADPLDVCGVDVQFGVSIRGLQVELGPLEQQASPTVRVRSGQVTASTTAEGIQELLRTAVQAGARQYGLRATVVELILESPDSKSVHAQIEFAAGIGPFLATAVASARVSIDERLEVRLSGFRMRGKGVLGRIAALIVRRSWRAFEGTTFPLAGMSLATAALQDVELETWPTVRLRALFARADRLIGAQSAAAAVDASDHAPPEPSDTALEIYIIDAGSNPPARRILDRHLHSFGNALSAHDLHVLTREQSEKVLESNPTMVGSDPIVLALDGRARDEQRGTGYGFRYSLGAVQDASHCTEVLEQILQLLADRERSRDVAAAIRNEAAAWRVDGAVQIVGAQRKDRPTRR